MLGSITFDLALGMVFVYLLLSLVVSAVREAIEARLKTRSKLLAHGIVQMLGEENSKNLYEHPLVKALYDGGKFEPGAAKFSGHQFFSWLFMLPASLFHQTKMPAYIPARTFALALLNLAATKTLVNRNASIASGQSDKADPAGSTLLDQTRAALAGRTDEVAKGLLAALSVAGNDVDKGVQAVQNWYDAAMDRVSGWYKRESQHIMFWLGLVVAVSMNVDSIYLIKYLATDAPARQSLATAAKTAAKDNQLEMLVDEQRKNRAAASDKPPTVTTAAQAAASGAGADPAATESAESVATRIKAADVKVADAIRSVTDLNLPIGWTRTRWNDFMDWSDPAFKNAWTILGWLVTAFGLSFGAPFWFDVLNKLMVVRSTVKPHEKSPEEPAKKA